MRTLLSDRRTGKHDLSLAPDVPFWQRRPLVPVALALVLLAFALLPRVQATPGLLWAVLGAAGFLLLWTLWLWVRARRGQQSFGIDLVRPVRAHYIQASVQLVVYAYWGWYWRDVYAQIPLIVAQLVFLYAFDALLTWTRGRNWRLGFGPLPIILSSNVFIWFKDDWFIFQFLLVATGALGKEFIKWNRDGRRTHIFNPSAFTLGLFALALIVTGTSDRTWAAAIAATISEPPHIYLVIFLLGLVVQYCFSITLMTLSAAAMLCLLTLGYYWITGTYFFLFSNVPAPVFLGLHLLVTDPSTSPRSSAGRIIFGALYGLGAFVFFGALHHLDGPTIYDKLLPVPLLNLSVRAIDRWADKGVFGSLNRWEAAFQSRRANLAYMGCWSALFLTLLGTGYVQSPHEGNSLGFWRRAVDKGQPLAASGLIELLKQHARAGSDSAWNELGLIYLEGELTDQDLDIAARDFARASRLGNVAGSANLASMYLSGKGGKSDADVQRAFDQLEQACLQGGGRQRFYSLVGRAYETGQGRPPDTARALEFFQAGCERGSEAACEGVARLGEPQAAGLQVAR